MLLPEQLLPSAFGMAWGWSVEQCLARLPITPSYEDAGMLGVTMSFNDSPCYIEFYFEDPAHPDQNYWYDMYGDCYSVAQGKLLAIYDHDSGRHIAVDTVDPRRSGLFRIETSLYTSQGFYEPDDEDESVRGPTTGTSLGPPAFSGSRYIKDPADDDKWLRNPPYPIGEFWSPLTYWDHTEGRLQVGLQQEDKECPISVDLVCYRIGGCA